MSFQGDAFRLKVARLCRKKRKTKIVVKLLTRGTGPPGREPIALEEQNKQ